MREVGVRRRDREEEKEKLGRGTRMFKSESDTVLGGQKLAEIYNIRHGHDLAHEQMFVMTVRGP